MAAACPATARTRSTVTGWVVPVPGMVVGQRQASAGKPHLGGAL
jgi:hypothetical protein